MLKPSNSFTYDIRRLIVIAIELVHEFHFVDVVDPQRIRAFRDFRESFGEIRRDVQFARMLVVRCDGDVVDLRMWHEEFWYFIVHGEIEAIARRPEPRAEQVQTNFVRRFVGVGALQNLVDASVAATCDAKVRVVDRRPSRSVIDRSIQRLCRTQSEQLQDGGR
jgi:hypothetical protein